MSRGSDAQAVDQDFFCLERLLRREQVQGSGDFVGMGRRRGASDGGGLSRVEEDGRSAALGSPTTAWPVSQYHLAKEIGVPPCRVNEIVHGQRRISADTALRLARSFSTSERFRINLQSRYDLEGRRAGWAMRSTASARLRRPAEPKGSALDAAGPLRDGYRPACRRGRGASYELHTGLPRNRGDMTRRPCCS